MNADRNPSLRYDRRKAEKRFAHVYESLAGDRCVYCGMPSDGKVDHQPPVYVLHRFANGGLVTKKQIRDAYGQCKLVPCCTICNMGLGAFHGDSDRDRRLEIVNWFLAEEGDLMDRAFLEAGTRLLEDFFDGKRGEEVFSFPGVGRVVYINALVGLANGTFSTPDDFPEWLQTAQDELAVWLRAAPRRKHTHFLAMANLESYDLLPQARSDPRGQFG